MSSSGFPPDAGTVLVVDASVVINLNATGLAPDIIRACPGEMVVTANACTELARGTRNGHKDGKKLQALIEAGAVRVVELGETGMRIYGSLVEGTALRTLDDGEAATIGYAYEAGAMAVIDERKARTLCAANFPCLTLASTVDLLLHDRIASGLGAKRQVEALVNALRMARMRVPPHQIDAVVSLIGPEAASTCNSLPRAIRAAARS